MANSQSLNTDNTHIVREVIQDLLINDAFIAIVTKSVDKQLRAMQEIIDRQDARIFDLENEKDQLKKDFKKLSDDVQAHGDKLRNINLKLNAEEQYSRRNCLRLFGHPEKHKENTDKIIMDIAKEHLEIDLSVDQIERSHRIGPKIEHPKDDDKPRGIIIKFKSYRTRNEIITNRRKLKGTKYAIVEDLTVQNQILLKQTRSNPKVKTAWSQDGRIIALLTELRKGTNKNKTKLIQNLDDLKLL